MDDRELETRHRAYLSALDERRFDDLEQFVHDELTYDELTYGDEPMTRQQ